MIGGVFLKKLGRGAVLRRIMNERLTDSLAVNLLSLASLFMGFRKRVYFDTVIRPHNAYCLLRAADMAKSLGYGRVTAIEFGVAHGAGLMNMAEIAAEVTKVTGVEVDLYGFDTGKGLPRAQDYRDHPEIYTEGDFPMDFDGLRARLPENCHLVIGDTQQTVGTVALSPDSPLGYIVLDVDYYSSAAACLKILEREAKLYLPTVHLYADDTSGEPMNPWCGEMLAMAEFSSRNAYRKICQYKSLPSYRPSKHGVWLEKMYTAHILDSTYRSPEFKRPLSVLPNPYFQ